MIIPRPRLRLGWKMATHQHGCVPVSLSIRWPDVLSGNCGFREATEQELKHWLTPYTNWEQWMPKRAKVPGVRYISTRPLTYLPSSPNARTATIVGTAEGFSICYEERAGGVTSYDPYFFIRAETPLIGQVEQDLRILLREAGEYTQPVGTLSVRSLH